MLLAVPVSAQSVIDPETATFLGQNPGHAVVFRKAAAAFGAITNVDRAEQLFALAPSASAIAFEAMDADLPVINYTDSISSPAPQGLFGGDRDIREVPGNEFNPLVDEDDFAMRARGYLYIPQPGVWNFSVNSDDGLRLRLGATGVVVAESAQPKPASTVTGSALVPVSGYYRYELVYFERSGGAEVEFFANGPGQSANQLVGSPAGTLQAFQSGGHLPRLEDLAITSPVLENRVATLTGQIVDPDVGDTFTLTVHWGDDSSTDTFTFGSATSFSLTHQYLDDPPSGTTSDLQLVQVTLTDSTSGSTDATISTTVRNVPPVIQHLTITSPVAATRNAFLSGEIVDPGSLDTFTLVVDWGDGTTAEALDLDSGAPFFLITHRYRQENQNYPVSLVLIDDDGGIQTTSTNVIVGAAPLLGGLVQETPLEQFNAGFGGITAGPDGAVWFTQFDRVGRLGTDGRMTEFGIDDTRPFGITTGPDRALWFTRYGSGKISRLTTNGALVDFTINYGAGPRSGPTEITAGPDQALWFVDANRQTIGRLTTNGAFSEFALAFGSQPFHLTTGPDAALWFTEFASNKIGRLTTNGVLTEFPLPAGTGPRYLAAGSDGALWFTTDASKIGRLSVDGQYTDFPAAPGSGLWGIASGADGALWFTDRYRDRIGRITTSGEISEFKLAESSRPTFLTAGGDGAVWFIEEDENQIGRLLLSSVVTISTGPDIEFNGLVATFSHAGPGGTPDDFTAQIDWGDGDVSSGVIVPQAAGGFGVTGRHIYGANGTYLALVTITYSYGNALVLQTRISVDLANVARLSIDATNVNAVTLSWSALFTNHVLEASVSLGSNALWNVVTNLPVSNSGRLQVTLPAAHPGSYFRLRKP